jgi:hypothetical protein
MHRDHGPESRKIFRVYIHTYIHTSQEQRIEIMAQKAANVLGHVYIHTYIHTSQEQRIEIMAQKAAKIQSLVEELAQAS